MVLSEETLKVKYRKEPFTSFKIEKGTLLTPSAKQFIADKGIELIFVDEVIQEKKETKVNLISSESPEKPENLSLNFQYVGTNGECYLTKPDYMTQVEGNTLVMKNNERIIFRGKVETFLADLLVTGKEILNTQNSEELQRDFETLIKFVNNIIVAETLDKVLENQKLLDGHSLDSIQEIAHNPKEKLGVTHLLEVTFNHDILVHKLNKLKALARGLETQAVDYFVQVDRINRKDLLKAFNVLSSAIYVMMLKYEKGLYR